MQPELPQGQQPSAPVPQELPTVPSVEQPVVDVPVDAVPEASPVQQVHEEATNDILSWQASEYIEREKPQIWFVGLGIVVLALLAVAIFVLRDFTFALLVVVMGAAVFVWARRPAGIMDYRLEPTGLWVNGKFFPLHDFRAFGVLQDGAIYAISLIPVKRFSPAVNIHFHEELGEQIVDILGESLPMEELEPDLIDRLSRRLNF